MSEDLLCQRISCKHPLSEHKRNPNPPLTPDLKDYDRWLCSLCHCYDPVSLDRKRMMVLTGEWEYLVQY